MKIKQIVWAAMLIALAPTVLHAQDKIITILGAEIEAKVESYDSQIIFYKVLSRADSIPTEQVREVSKADGQRIVVIPKSQEGQKQLISDTDYLKALEENQVSILLRSQTILKGVNFYTGRYLLTSTAQQELKKIANLFKKQNVTHLELVVHTDSSGKALNNLELSEKCAQNLKDFLVDQGLVGIQINATGKGEAEPIFGGKDQQALNRRVELSIKAIQKAEILYAEKYIKPTPPAPPLELVVNTIPQVQTETNDNTTLSKDTSPLKKSKKIKSKPFTAKKEGIDTQKKWNAQVVIGGLGTYPIGESIERVHETFGQEHQLSDSIHTFRNSVWPIVFPSGGLELKYQLTPRWCLVSGLRFARQGFSLHKNYTYRDPEFKYDEIYKGRIIYKINTLDIPIYIEGKLGKRLAWGMGTSLSFAVSERQQIIKYQKKVIINGKKSMDESLDWQKQVNNMSEYTRAMFPTALFNLNIRTSQHWDVQLRSTYSLNQFKDRGNVSNASAFLGMSYRFSKKN